MIFTSFGGGRYDPSKVAFDCSQLKRSNKRKYLDSSCRTALHAFERADFSSLRDGARRKFCGVVVEKMSLRFSFIA